MLHLHFAIGKRKGKIFLKKKSQYIKSHLNFGFGRRGEHSQRHTLTTVLCRCKEGIM
jgi:hypothetical protein